MVKGAGRSSPAVVGLDLNVAEDARLRGCQPQRDQPLARIRVDDRGEGGRADQRERHAVVVRIGGVQLQGVDALPARHLLIADRGG